MTDAEALPLLLAALRTQGSSLAAALKLPAEAVALQRRACWLRTFCARQLLKVASTPDQAAAGEHGTPWTTPVSERAEQERILRRGAGLPDLSDAALLPDLESWAGPSLAGARSLVDAHNVTWHAVLRCWLHLSRRMTALY